MLFRPPTFFIAAACVALALGSFPSFMMFASLVVAAASVGSVVRWVNLRDDPRHHKRPSDSS
jgi:hypothetical protein